MPRSSNGGSKVKGRTLSEITIYRDKATGRFISAKDAKKAKKKDVNEEVIEVARDPFGRFLPAKEPRSLGIQIGKAGSNLCFDRDRKILFDNVKRDYIALKKSEKDELEKERIHIYFQLTEKKHGWQTFDVSGFGRFLLQIDGSDRETLLRFWSTDPKMGVCTKKKRVFIAYDKRDKDGRRIGVGKIVKEYTIKINPKEVK